MDDEELNRRDKIHAALISVFIIAVVGVVIIIATRLN